MGQEGSGGVMSGPFSLSDDELDAMTDTMLDAQARASSARVLGRGRRRVGQMPMFSLSLLKPFVERARKELQEKSLGDIHYETACVWAARALVAYDAGITADADDCAHEAAEHAALAELQGNAGIVAEILGALRKARQLALGLSKELP